MRVPNILLAFALVLLPVSLLLAKEAPDPGLHTFYGQVALIDPAKKVIVFGVTSSGSSFIIQSRPGSAAPWVR